MTAGTDHKSGKGSGDENFPVASHLIARRHREPVLAYYRFARSADDAADHPSLSQGEKLRLLDDLEATLLGHSDSAVDAIPLRRVLAERGMSPRHALDLLVAFRQDVSKKRYETWDELMTYCRYSAAPVGRFVLDVHGEHQDTYTSSDALCTALQVINHLQDCGKDFRTIERVYLPQEILAANGASIDMLNAAVAPRPLRLALKAIAAKTEALMPDATSLSKLVADRRLGLETAIIARLASRILRMLEVRDPLSEAVHLSKPKAAFVAVRAVVGQLVSQVVASGAPQVISVRGPR